MEKEPRKLLFGATPLLFLLLIIFLYTQLFASISIPFNQWMQQLTNANTRRFNEEATADQESITLALTRLVTGEDLNKFNATGFACDSAFYSKVCVANGPLRIDTTTLIVHMPCNHTIPQDGTTMAIRPYARQDSNEILNDTSPVQIQQHQETTHLPACHYIHQVPAVIFSTSGFRGNLFHEFNEVIIPLFITSRHFQSNVQFILTDYNPSFVSRYSHILSHLSRYQVMDPVANGSVHCFPAAVVGLKFHNFLSLNSSDIINPGGYSMLDFKQFLRESYNLKNKNLLLLSDTERPVLILISRVKSRAFLNEEAMVNMMEELGFRVVITRPGNMSDLAKFSELVNSCSVMVGAHGAGLTNEVFLPSGAVVVQVVPLGLEWPSSVYFGEPSKELGVEYVEYKIQAEESSLIDMYSRDDPVIVDPESIFAKGFQVGRAVYITGQNMKIDIVRFRKTLVEAIGFLQHQNQIPSTSAP